MVKPFSDGKGKGLGIALYHECQR